MIRKWETTAQKNNQEAAFTSPTMNNKMSNKRGNKTSKPAILSVTYFFYLHQQIQNITIQNKDVESKVHVHKQNDTSFNSYMRSTVPIMQDHWNFCRRELSSIARS